MSWNNFEKWNQGDIAFKNRLSSLQGFSQNNRYKGYELVKVGGTGRLLKIGNNIENVAMIDGILIHETTERIVECPDQPIVPINLYWEKILSSSGKWIDIQIGIDFTYTKTHFLNLGEVFIAGGNIIEVREYTGDRLSLSSFSFDDESITPKLFSQYCRPEMSVVSETNLKFSPSFSFTYVGGPAGWVFAYDSFSIQISNKKWISSPGYIENVAYPCFIVAECLENGTIILHQKPISNKLWGTSFFWENNFIPLCFISSFGEVISFWNKPYITVGDILWNHTRTNSNANIYFLDALMTQGVAFDTGWEKTPQGEETPIAHGMGTIPRLWTVMGKTSDGIIHQKIEVLATQINFQIIQITEDKFIVFRALTDTLWEFTKFSGVA
ncbi:MAG: hypothetical protein NC833_03300 [Candidatus Omnitrophica bacterium]|nr:hypothetical protein [Candidatus Omnitrophota bacterium]